MGKFLVKYEENEKYLNVNVVHIFQFIECYDISLF